MNELKVPGLPIFKVEAHCLLMDGVVLDDATSAAFLDHMYVQVCDMIAFFENRDATNGTVVTLDENSNESTPARDFPSFNFENYSIPEPCRVVQSGVSL